MKWFNGNKSTVSLVNVVDQGRVGGTHSTLHHCPYGSCRLCNRKNTTQVSMSAKICPLYSPSITFHAVSLRLHLSCWIHVRTYKYISNFWFIFILKYREWLKSFLVEGKDHAIYSYKSYLSRLGNYDFMAISFVLLLHRSSRMRHLASLVSISLLAWYCPDSSIVLYMFEIHRLLDCLFNSLFKPTTQH